MKRALDRMAYASLILDVCIAVITTLAFFDVHYPTSFLPPINLMLTVVVVLSVVLFGILILLRTQESRLPNGEAQATPGRLDPLP